MDNGSMALISIDSLNEAQVLRLHELFVTTWWTNARELADVRRMLEHTDLQFGLAEEQSGELVAFARVLTDHVYKALVLDVVVDPERRGAGIGRRLMEEVLAHPVIAAVQHVELYCLPERYGFYGRLGFECELGELTFMRRTSPDAAAASERG